ncbi:thiamine-phosphate kinase [Paenibacillus soyae]|uniref:Thiamine-monophosphate kinase n=1 Tax=Paenibacillus soyae TaxID=2969249 RepID=A0A9X2MPG8_9BACL|nr:thiamine-phosphate kinase [Paenibacillus soyae]MCR2803446.1 thiamine-phosphate kinase [Paenibacillus soyae]
MDEFASIRHWTAGRQTAEWQRRRGVTLGIGDDAAAVDLSLAEAGLDGAGSLLIAVDTMVETVHFAEGTMADEDVGYKALAANVSDIAAMGGVPLHAVVSVSVPSGYGSERMRRVYDGLYVCAEQYGIAVIGGDTTSAPSHMVVSVTLTGTVETGKELRRSGARPGDAVFVTGPLGMSAAGLHLLLREEAGTPDSEYAAIVAAHKRPKPSVLAGRLLLKSGACRSLNDVSDGLASEAWELAEASGLRIVLEEGRLPKSGSLSAYAAKAGIDPLEWMLYGGEDYVLVGTVESGGADAVQKAFHERGLPFYIIGKAEAGEPDVELIPLPKNWNGERASGRIARRKIGKRGYNHFDE